MINVLEEYTLKPVSYTHLDVYKRQAQAAAACAKAKVAADLWAKPAGARAT